MLRHRLDAVDAGAEVDAIEIQLEDLRLGQLRFHQDGDRRFLRLAPVRFDVGEEEGPRKLLRQRAAAFDASAIANVTNYRPAEADRIDARVVIEPPVFDRDDGVLKVLGNLRERNIVALLVEAEPRLTVGA